ncbi:MAG: hypothetical protein V3S06_02810 [candidate division Zixibacteria bacterium]
MAALASGMLEAMDTAKNNAAKFVALFFIENAAETAPDADR